MPILLARTRRGDSPPGAVHAYRVTAIDTPPTQLQAVCGHCPESTEYLEQVDEFDGLPCTPCLVLTLADSHQPPTEVAVSPPLAPTEATGHGRYAIEVRGDSLVHLVAPHSPRALLDGGQAVHTRCGALGFGPLTQDSIPVGWSLCGECRGLDDERSLAHVEF